MPSVTRLIRRRLPVVYRIGRTAFEVTSNRLPPWTLPPIPGPVSRADLMLSPGLVQKPEQAEIVAYDRIGREAVAVLTTAVTESGRTPEDIGSILDLGCGHGRVARHLGAAFPNARLAGCDLDPHAAAFCKRSFGMDAVAVTNDATTMPRGPYDLIWLGSVLTHIDERSFQTMVREVTARLTEGGVAVFTTHPVEAGETLGTPDGDVTAADVSAALAARGFYYVPYPHSADGSYGLTFITPEHLEATVESSAAHPMRKVLHHHQGWDAFQDVWAFARTA